MVKKRDETADADDDAFARAMADENVVPILREPHRRVRATPPVSLPPVAQPSGTARAAEHENESNDEFAANGVDRRELRKLKGGKYDPAGRFDVHGMTAEAAAAAVRQFVAGSSRRGHRCVCIVHGRGRRSPGGIAVLKARVRHDLRSHPAVLAYADAPRSDGGSGAVYVLLRRQA